MSPSLLVLMAKLTLVERPKFPETSPGSGSILLAGSTPHLSVGYPIWRDRWELAKDSTTDAVSLATESCSVHAGFSDFPAVRPSEQSITNCQDLSKMSLPAIQ